MGLRLWDGEYEGWQATWLRWCDERGNLLPTGKELAEQEKARAEQEKARAEQEKARADAAETKMAAMVAKLRELGFDPNAV